jgi:PmbA protein
MAEQSQAILQQVLAAGFDQAQVIFDETSTDELNIENNQVNLLRSKNTLELSITAIKDHRQVKASTTQIDGNSTKLLLEELLQSAQATPPDEAHALSENQKGTFVQGPKSVDRDSMVQTVRGILDLQEKEFSHFLVKKGAVAYNSHNLSLINSQGTELELQHGSYSTQLYGASKDQHGSSTNSGLFGFTEQLPKDVGTYLNLRGMLEDSLWATQAKPLGEKFTGDLLLTPEALYSLTNWLRGNISTPSLLTNSSLYKDSVGDLIASELLTYRHIHQGTMVTPFNMEGFLVDSFDLIKEGRLQHLIPSYYGSRKLDLPHIPTGWGWEILPGSSTKEEMLASISKGAVVNYLSMGRPSSSGDFSGVMKNSFLIEHGKRTRPLTETMVSGNMAQMLLDIAAISRETMNYGDGDLPWVLIKGLQFS